MLERSQIEVAPATAPDGQPSWFAVFVTILCLPVLVPLLVVQFVIGFLLAPPYPGVEGEPNGPAKRRRVTGAPRRSSRAMVESLVAPGPAHARQRRPSTGGVTRAWAAFFTTPRGGAYAAGSEDGCRIATKMPGAGPARLLVASRLLGG